ncbi:conjugal transfer protein TrbH [Devosia sp. Naph2]|uniref:conjugal transfer protein TrbH n=1 Tax=Devosia polycyclovorans TaxID=3345148 RepID=UPI0035D110E8
MAISKSVPRCIAVLAMTAILVGCATTGGYFSPMASLDAAELDTAAANGVAADLVTQLEQHVGAGTGTIALMSDQSTFALALEQHLRERGYAVDPEAQGADAIPLAFTLDTGDGLVLARLSTSTVELTRFYAVSDGGVAPSSPVSVLHRENESGASSEFV